MSREEARGLRIDMKKFKQRELTKEQKKQLSEFKRNQRKNIGKIIDRKQKEMFGYSLKFIAAIMLVLLFIKVFLGIADASILHEDLRDSLLKFLFIFTIIIVTLGLMSVKTKKQNICMGVLFSVVSCAMIIEGNFLAALFLIFFAFQTIRLAKIEGKKEEIVT